MASDRTPHSFLNELPDDTGLKEVEHQKIKFVDVFPGKFCEITNSHVRKLQSILNRYDVVIFMARKAICFYKALLQNGELYVPPSCTIFSSRILSFNIWDKLQGKNVALVDDVVIHGRSINNAKTILETHNIAVDIYISALMCQADSSASNEAEPKWYKELIRSIQRPFVFLNETDIYSYANYITRFIEASMLPYNIDQPTVLVKYGKEDLSSFMREHRLTEITSSVQKKFGIRNQVIHYSGEILRPVLGSVHINLSEISIKLRVFHNNDTRQLLIFPIILFPVVPMDTIDHVYEHIRTDKLDAFIYHNNPKIERENKIKLLIYVLNHYILSRFLWCEREHGRLFEYCGFDSNEKILFSQSIFKPDFAKATLSEKLSKLKMPYKWEQKTTVRPTFFNEYLGIAYALLFSKDRDDIESMAYTCYLDADGNRIRRKIFTLQGFFEDLKKYAKSKQYCMQESESLGVIDCVDTYLVSNIIDVLIDRGILVPEIVHTQNGGIIRAYRCGEVAKLNEIEFALFSYMLSYYSTHMWKGNDVIELKGDAIKKLGKREIEQLCVLYFRSAAKSGLFETLSDPSECQFEDDVYSIYYSVFGPTVSRLSAQKYEVSDKDKLITSLIDYGHMTKHVNNKYQLSDSVSSNLDEKWKSSADIFANDMLFLRQIFVTSTNMRHNTNFADSETMALWKNFFSKVRSFDELLTLMSIGENEMQRTLSIVAEIKIIADMKTERIQSALSYFMNHMDCVWEGIWKSSCYVNPDLLDNIQRTLKLGKSFRDKNDISKIFQHHVDESARVDRNKVIAKFLSQCGEFFYRTYYTVLIINKYINRYAREKVDIESKYKIPNRIKYEKQYKSLWDAIEQRYSQCNSYEKVSRIALVDLVALQREALAILDICDLYLYNNAFGYQPSHKVIMICANNPDILNEINLESRSCDFNQVKTGKLSDHRFFRCFLIGDDLINDSDYIQILSKNIDALISSLQNIEKNKWQTAEITIAFYCAEKWYESLFISGDTCSGKFVEIILKDMAKLEKKWRRSSDIELFTCGISDNIMANISSVLATIINKRQTSIIQNYSVSNYQIQIPATKANMNSSVNISGDLNGTIINTMTGGQVAGKI